MGFLVKHYHPRNISNKTLRDDELGQNVTELSYKTMKQLLKCVLKSGFKITTAYIGNSKVFASSIQRRFYKDFPNVNF